MKLLKGFAAAALMSLTSAASADCGTLPVVNTCADILGAELTGSLEEEGSELQVYDRFLNDEEQGFNTVAKPLVLMGLFELSEEDTACMETYLNAIEPLIGCEYAQNVAAADEEGKEVLQAELRDFATLQIGTIALTETVEDMKEAVFALYAQVAAADEE